MYMATMKKDSERSKFIIEIVCKLLAFGNVTNSDPHVLSPLF